MVTDDGVSLWIGEIAWSGLKLRMEMMENCPLKKSFPFIIYKCSIQACAQAALCSMTFGLGERRTNKSQVMEATRVYDLTKPI